MQRLYNRGLQRERVRWVWGTYNGIEHCDPERVVVFIWALRLSVRSKISEAKALYVLQKREDPTATTRR
jgi:hypothetical protein